MLRHCRAVGFLLFIIGREFLNLPHRPADVADNRFQRLIRFIGDNRALLNPFRVVMNVFRDFFRRPADALRQLPDFIGDDGKTAPMLSGAGGFNRGIQGKQIGLFGDFADDFDNVGNLLRAFRNRFHAVHRLRDRLLSVRGGGQGFFGQRNGFLRFFPGVRRNRGHAQHEFDRLSRERDLIMRRLRDFVGGMVHFRHRRRHVRRKR